MFGEADDATRVPYAESVLLSCREVSHGAIALLARGCALRQGPGHMDIILGHVLGWCLGSSHLVAAIRSHSQQSDI